MLSQQIIFPPGVTTDSVGRNGCIITTGLFIDGWEQGITLTPRTSRGAPGRCNIELPNDPAVVLAIIRALLRINHGAETLLREELLGQ